MFLSAIRQFSQKSNILVVGGGQIGKSVALGLNRHGYENITVADPNNANQAVLEEAGIKESIFRILMLSRVDNDDQIGHQHLKIFANIIFALVRMISFPNAKKFVSSSAGLGSQAEVLFTALPKPEHVRFVMEESDLLGELNKETIWIDHTSTDPDEAVRLSAKATKKGIDNTVLLFKRSRITQIRPKQSAKKS